MPTYSYKCSACGNVFDKVQSINSRPRAVCPKCDTLTKHRLITQIGGIIFNGWFPGKEIARKETNEET